MWRSAQARVALNAESISQSPDREKRSLVRFWGNLYQHSRHLLLLRYWASAFDDLFFKYGATLAGHIAMIVPHYQRQSHFAQIINAYVRCVQYFRLWSSAVGTLLLLPARTSMLNAYVSAHSEFVETLRRFNTPLPAFSIRPDDSAVQPLPANDALKRWLVTWKSRAVQPASDLFIEHVTVVSPYGRVLVKDLSLVCQAGHNVLVTGRRGSGKSSLFRVLGGLWPAQGTIKASSLMTLPQRPYFSLGSLRDQIIYPDSEADMQAKSVSDADLASLLHAVDPGNFFLRQWTLDSQRDWTLAINDNQKQRLVFCRIFYHLPRFAALDEPTTALSPGLIARLYEISAALGITLIIATENAEPLASFHDQTLHLGDNGSWSLVPRPPPAPKPTA